MNKVLFFEDKIYLSQKNWDESFNELESVMFDNMKIKSLNAIKKLYLNHNFTVREICGLFDIEYKKSYQKLFHSAFGSKGMNHGGKRKGSGNKKGFKFKK